MASWTPIQNSFHVGEVSARISMRQDIEQYKQAAYRMVNWMTNPQGTVERVPGSRFLSEVAAGDDPVGRVIAFRDANETDALLVLLDGAIEVRTDVPLFGGQSLFKAGGSAPTANIVKNSSFIDGEKFWDFTPLFEYTTGQPSKGVLFNTTEGKSLGIVTASILSDGTGASVEYLKQTIKVPVATSVITYNMNAMVVTRQLIRPDDMPADAVIFVLKVYAADGTTLLGSAPVINYPSTGGVETNAFRSGRINIGVDYVGDLVLSIEGITTPPPSGEDRDSTIIVLLAVDSVVITATSDKPSEDVGAPADPDALVHYTAEEIPAVHFVQSPYSPSGSDIWKELVLVHPKYPPRILYWDFVGAEYVYRNLAFFKDDTDPATAPNPVPFTPTEWATDHYPASCSAYQGRLVLGGGGSNGEDVILSVTNEWGNLFDIEINYNPAAAFPTSALKFTTTFRSASRWVAGQKDLFIGAAELEYRVSSDGGILRPGDIDARVQTSHGSVNVQPIPMGDEIVFPAENGKKLRALKYRRESLGYVATDLTLLHPFILSVGVVRMVRLRNPHQILLCVLADGSVAMLHYEPSVGLTGWSRMTTLGSYIDVTVMRDEKGRDVPIFLVQRKNVGVPGKALLMEAITQWTVNTDWFYMDSFVVYDNITGTNIIPGFDHLEGRRLNVVADDSYLGDFLVEGGVITLVDGYGEPIIPDLVAAGLPKWSNLVLLPPVVDEGSTGGIGAMKRYRTVGVRLRNSRAPIINGTRPPDRAGKMQMDTAAPLSDLVQVRVANTGHDELQFIQIAEVLPVRCEVVGVYGQLESENL